MTTDYATRERTIRLAARALGRHGLVHAYGHCSVRIDTDSFLVAPPRPLGLIAPGEPCILVPLDGPLPENVLGEVRIHREIYRRRPDVRGIVRSMPPQTMTLSTLSRTPRARHGLGCYFQPGPALWDDPQLIRSDAQAAGVAERLGEGRAVLMRGNGAVTAGSSLEEATVLTWYLEDAARIELSCLALGPIGEAGLIDAAAAEARATWSGRILDRMWDFLIAGDPESRAP